MKRIYIFVLLVLALSSCHDNAVDSLSPVYDDIMRFNILSPTPQTKAGAGTFEPEDQIGLYVTDFLDETTPMPLQISGNRANNSVVSFDGTSWTPDQTIYWGEGKSDVYAYHPYCETITDVNNHCFEVAVDQTGDGYESSDFLWCKAEGVHRTAGSVDLNMKHAMSKLTVKIIAGEDYIGSLPDDATVILHSTVTKANINLETGSAVKDPHSSANMITMKNLGVKSSGDVEAVVYEAILVPQKLETKLPLLEIKSKSVSYLIEDSFNFRPGIAYTYTVTLNTSTTAIKVEIGCELEDWNNVGSGDEGEGDEGSGDSGEGETGNYTDLSAKGSANCYLIQQAGDYKFKAVVGNTNATVGNVKSVHVLWESFGSDERPSVGDLIASVLYKNGYVHFSTPESFREGNAVIAVKNSKGSILWSWHIWCSEEGWKEQKYYNNAGTMMDRNIGATSATPGDAGALGLMYQWGRKDPFPGSSSISYDELARSTGKWEFKDILNDRNQYITRTKEPMTLFKYLIDIDSWQSAKTHQDPCPAGWRLPDGGTKSIWAKALGSKAGLSVPYDGTSMGVNFASIFGDDSVIWYPYTGAVIHYEEEEDDYYEEEYEYYEEDGDDYYEEEEDDYYEEEKVYIGMSSVGYDASYLSCTWDKLSYGGYFSLNLSYGRAEPSYKVLNNISRAGFPVRCQKE